MLDQGWIGFRPRPGLRPGDENSLFRPEPPGSVQGFPAPAGAGYSLAGPQGRLKIPAQTVGLILKRHRSPAIPEATVAGSGRL